MKLPLSCIFFWLQKTFPKTVCAFPDLRNRPEEEKSYAYPIFSDAAAEAGHVVIAVSAEPPCLESLPEDSLLVIPGVTLPDGISSPCIVLGTSALSLSEVYNLIMSVFARFDRLQENLRLAVDDALSYQAILDYMEDVTAGAAIFLVDENFHFVALCSRAREEIKAYADEDNHFSPKQLFRQLPYQRLQEASSLTGPYHLDGLLQGQCRNLFLHHSLVGRLAIRCDTAPLNCAYYSAVLDIGVSYIEKLYRRTGGFHTHKDSAFNAGYYLSRILNDEYIDREELQICLSSLGWEESSLFHLVLLKKSNALSGSFSSEIIAEQILASLGEAVCLPWDDGLLFLRKADHPKDQMIPPPPWLEGLLETFALKAGVGRLFSDIHRMRIALRQAQAAIEMGRIYSPACRIYLFDDYSFHYLLRNGQAGFSAYDIGDPALQILDEYDRRHETKLSLTLYTYLRLHCNATASARGLFITRGSLLKRITRIQELTGVDFDDFWRYSYLLFSYSLRIAQEKAMAETGAAPSAFSPLPQTPATLDKKTI